MKPLLIDAALSSNPTETINNMVQNLAGRTLQRSEEESGNANPADGVVYCTVADVQGVSTFGGIKVDVFIPEGVQTIQAPSMDGLSSSRRRYNRIEIPDSVTNITGGFLNNAIVDDIVFGAGIHDFTTIGDNSTVSKSITFKSSAAPSFAPTFFSEVDSSASIYVPAESADAYKTALASKDWYVEGMVKAL